MLRPDVQLGAARRTRFRELERPPSTGALDVLHALLADAHDEKVGSIWSQEVEVVPTITLVVGGDRSRIQPSSDAREQHEDFELARNVLHTHGHRVDSRIRVDLGRHQAVHTHTLPTGREVGVAYRQVCIFVYGSPACTCEDACLGVTCAYCIRQPFG